MKEFSWPKNGEILVAVADSTRIHSQLLADALKRDRRLQVVAAVSSSHELLEVAEQVPLHVALINCSLDEDPSRGFQILRELQRIRPVRCVVMLESSKQELVIEAFRAGARGIFCKQESLRSLCKCLRCVHDGQVWANSSQLIYALDALTSTHPPIRAVDSKGGALLSKRELEVVEAVAEGLTNHEIGERLHISRHTVKNYLLRIYDKVGVSSRMELLFFTLSTKEMKGGEPAGPKKLQAQPDPNTITKARTEKPVATVHFISG